MSIKQEFLEAQKVLSLFIEDKNSFLAIEEAGKIMVEALKNGNKIISCGNGGSMCDAMHFSEELTGRYRNDRPAIAAISISDPSHISCVANDYGYDFVFSRFIEGVGKKGDVLLAISTSGNSKNVIKAVESAKNIGLKVIVLTGKDGGQLASQPYSQKGIADIEIRAPKSNFADRVQEIHIKVIHNLIHYIEQNL